MKSSLVTDPYPLFHSGESTPSEQLAECLARIDADEGDIRAFVHLAKDEARAAAARSDERWRAGRPLSDVDGLVIGVKDVIESRDMPTGQGSPICAGAQTGRDAACLQSLREAGAIILGKCTTTEFAYVTPLHDTRNPHDLQRTPGGSSSGSAAAVAAGFVHAALGTQVLGSTLRPASYCGCVGYKTSLGALHRGGIFDPQSQGCIGIFGDNARQVWSIAKAIALRAGGDPGHRTLAIGSWSLEPRRPRTLALLSPGTWGRAEDRAISELQRVAYTLRESEGVDIADRHSDPRVRAFEESLNEISTRSYALVDWEHRWPVTGYRRQCPEGISPELATRIAQCEKELTHADYHALLDWRDSLRKSFERFADCFNGVLCLAATAEAPLGLQTTGDVSMNIPASTLGAPAISLPLLTCNQLPLGLQIIGGIGHDRQVVEIAHWLEQSALAAAIRE